MASEGRYDGHDGLGLDYVKFREGVDSAAVLQFLESEPRAQEEGAVADRHDDVVGETVRGNLWEARGRRSLCLPGSKG